MKRFRANYALANPNFYIINLVDNPIDTAFSELLNDIKKNFEWTYPSIMSAYLKTELGDIADIPNYSNPADDFKKAVEKKQNFINPMITKLQELRDLSI
jgi:hypothetical protein